MRYLLPLMMFTQVTFGNYVLPNSDNLCIYLGGNSLFKDGNSDAPQTGCMAPDYFGSGLYLLHPEHTNDTWINAGRSGSTMFDQSTAMAEVMYPFMSYNLIHGYPTNALVNISISDATDNGNLSSNSMYPVAVTNFLALTTTTNSHSYTNEGGTSVSNLVIHLGLSDTPGSTLDGGGTGVQSTWARMTAITNAGVNKGGGYIDGFNPLLLVCSNWVQQGEPVPLTYKVGPKAGHYTALLELMWAFTWWMQLYQGQTNVSNAELDYAGAGAIVSTNNCTVSSVTKSGNTLHFVRRNYSLPPGWDVAGSVDSQGNVTTNDCSALGQVWPAAANFWQYTLQVDNLPVGTYYVYENSKLIGVLSSTILGNRWNMTTNYVGDCWQQRVNVLATQRDLENSDRVTLITTPSGRGFPQLGSACFGAYPTHTGDDLEAQVDTIITGLRTNSTFSYSAARTAAQPVDYTYDITPAPTSGYVPAPFR